MLYRAPSGASLLCCIVLWGRIPANRDQERISGFDRSHLVQKVAAPQGIRRSALAEENWAKGTEQKYECKNVRPDCQHKAGYKRRWA